MKKEIKYNTILSPFKWFILENFPYIEEDFDALTNWQLFCKLGKEMNKVIAKVNACGEQTENLTNAFNELYNYVNNYFDNLDVQEEINNKLDEMVKEGTLQEIISKYLNSTAIFGFDNVNSMVNATNLINGSFAKTLGYYEKNDGGSGLYKIRTRTFEDVVDNGSIILMSDETLVAELILFNNLVDVKLFGAKNDLTYDSINSFNNAITYCKNNKMTLLLNGYFNISTSLDTKGVKIKGIGKQIRITPTYTSKTYGFLGYDYLKNENDGALVDFNDYCESTLISGSGIVSETANPILKCDYKDGRFELENLAIIGWLRNSQNQIGCQTVITDENETYFSGRHHFDNVTVANCSGTGIKLHSLEQTEMNNCNLEQNFGYGLHIQGFGVGSGKDTPFELVTFNRCFIDTNKLGGVYAENTYRSNVYFNNCDVGRNGLYSILNLSIPENIEDVNSGIKIKGWGGYTNPAQRTTNINTEFNNVYGEELVNLIQINAVEEEQIHLFNNLTIKNCTSNNTINTSKNCLVYLNSQYFGNLNYYDNYFVSNSNSGTEVTISENVQTITPNICSRAFYNSYNEVKSSQITSTNINITNISYKKIGNSVVKLSITGTATSNIAQWATIISGLQAPIENFTSIALNNTTDTPFRISVNTNRTIGTSKAIASGDQVTIDLTYLTLPN